jgi:fumarate reductase subunit D
MSSALAVLYGAIVSTVVTPILILMVAVVYSAMPLGLAPPSFQNSASFAMDAFIVALGLADLSGWLALISGLIGGEY